MWSLNLLKFAFVRDWIKAPTLCVPLFFETPRGLPQQISKILTGALVAQGEHFAGYKWGHLQIAAQLIHWRGVLRWCALQNRRRRFLHCSPWSSPVSFSVML